MTWQTGVMALAVLVGLTGAAQAQDHVVPTRFGAVGVVHCNSLTFRGKAFSPAIVRDNGLQVTPGDVHPIGDVDAVVVTDIGASACGPKFFVLTIGKTGVKVSDEFGNCSEVLETRVKKGKLQFSQLVRGQAGRMDHFVFDPATNAIEAK